MSPLFFIAEFEETIQHDDYTVYISGKEYAQSHWNTLAEELNQSFKRTNDASSIEALIKERIL